MDEAIRKARVLIEALSWIQRFRGRYVVIKLGGSTLDDAAAVDSLLVDVVFMAAVGMRPVIVHGGGKAISTAMQAAGIAPRFVAGRRYTDVATLQIAARVLIEEICQSLVDRINVHGCRATGLHCSTENVLTAEKLMLRDEHNNPLDLGHVGTVTAVDIDTISRVCSTGTIPVIPSIALSPVGHRLNINADTAAAAVSRGLSPPKNSFFSAISQGSSRTSKTLQADYRTSPEPRFVTSLPMAPSPEVWFPKSKLPWMLWMPVFAKSILSKPPCPTPYSSKSTQTPESAPKLSPENNDSCLQALTEPASSAPCQRSLDS